MARTEGDRWDLKSSVGTTATMVAAARALASEGRDALIDDPFAAPLVRAVGVEYFTRLIDGDIRADGGDAAPVDPRRVIDVMAVRTKFFDDFFTASADAGIRQAVILASGLDSRAYRLPWPTGSVVYEIDQSPVIEFKLRTLAGLGASPRAEHRPVAVDLRDDWPNALRDGNFDETQPTAWIAEGLLLYLPHEAQDRLFDDITSLSAPGSRLATEYHPDGGAAMTERSKAMAHHWREHGLDLDLSELVYAGERTPVTDYLAAHGWKTSAQSRADLFAAYGLTAPGDENSAPMRNTVEVTAVLQP